VRVGSHLDVSKVLATTAEEGMPFEDVVGRIPGLEARPVVLVTGSPGDVYLCHPFLVHAASWPHRGRAPRVIAQPALVPVGLLCLERPDRRYSAVERVVRVGLGLG
jgi:hypothetical protein